MRRSIAGIAGLLLLCAATVLPAAEFQDFQAARAVIGQPSFSAHDKGVVALSLALNGSNLYVAETSGHVLTFDTARIGSAKTAGCPVCLMTPQATTAQSVFEGVAAVAVSGSNIVVADPKSQTVMIWGGPSAANLLSGQPDVVLSGFVKPTAVAIDHQRLYVGDAGAHHVFVWNHVPTSNAQKPDVTLGSIETAETGADTIQTPSALASDGENLFVADEAAHRVLVFSAEDAEMPEAVNAASLVSGPLAPGTLVALEHAASANATVFLNGSALPVTDVNGDQLQVQIPYELNGAAAGSLWIKNEAGSLTAPVAVRFTSASPGIFAFGAKEPRTGLLLHAPTAVPLSPEEPAEPSQLITVWATGLGAVAAEANEDGSFNTLNTVQATVNGNAVEVVSAVLPKDATGVYEVKLRMPAQLPSGSILTLAENDSRSNPVTFPVAAQPK